MQVRSNRSLPSRYSSAAGRILPCWALACLLLCAGIVSPAAAAERPLNIVLLLTDDHRFDCLGSMGNSIIQTPHLDRLAEQGSRFTQAFCTTSICMTSRASLLTGQYARRHGVVEFSKMLSPEAFAQTFPLLLRKQGYRTGFVGKWGIGQQMPKEHYDYWAGFPGQGRYFTPGDPEHLTDKMGRQALEFLDGCSAERPFCLQVSFKAAHCQDNDPWPFQPAKRHDALYNDLAIPFAANATEEAFRALPEFLRESEGRVRWKVRFANPERAQKSLKDYYRLITGVDDVVGQLVERLRERGLADNTAIVFTADNGMYLGEHGLADKWFMHEESIRVPLLVYDPRLPEKRRGEAVDAMALNIDVAATILDLAGQPIPSQMQGRSLKPLMRGESTGDGRREFFYEHLFVHKRIPRSEGVRGERWKYVRYLDIEPLHEELYDLASDPLELANLAGDSQHAEKLAEMRERWRLLSKAAE